jgi:hypothetical protein
MHCSRWAVCLFVFIMLSGCSGTVHKEVFAIERTATYHRSKCPPVHMARTLLMTLDEAKALHLKPCPVCKPDLL